MGGVESRLGTVLAGRYKLIKEIGVGGMATVYSAVDSNTGAKVAVKMLSDTFAKDSSALRRFRIEAQAAGSIRHDNVVAVHHFGESDGAYFIVMDLIEGVTLSSLIKKGPLKAGQVAKLGSDIAAGLEAIHSHGIVHRDIKPGNVIVDPQGNAKITDFGIALVDEDLSLTKEGSVVGTATYFAPEQAKGRRGDQKSDLYSLGVLLYQMTAGKLPFTGASAVSVAYKHVQEKPPKFADELEVPNWLNKTIRRLLSKKPQDRIATAGTVAALLSERTAPAANIIKRAESVPVTVSAPLATAAPVVTEEHDVSKFFLPEESSLEIIPDPQPEIILDPQPAVIADPMPFEMLEEPVQAPAVLEGTPSAISVNIIEGDSPVKAANTPIAITEQLEQAKPIASLVVVRDDGEEFTPFPAMDAFVVEDERRRRGGFLKFAAVLAFFLALGGAGFLFLDRLGNESPGFAGPEEGVSVAEDDVSTTLEPLSPTTTVSPVDDDPAPTASVDSTETTLDEAVTTTDRPTLTTVTILPTTTLRPTTTQRQTTVQTVPPTTIVPTTTPTTLATTTSTTITTTTTLAPVSWTVAQGVRGRTGCLGSPVPRSFEAAIGTAFDQIGSTGFGSDQLISAAYSQADLVLPTDLSLQINTLQDCGYEQDLSTAINTPGALLYDDELNGHTNGVGISVGDGIRALVVDSDGVVKVVAFLDLSQRFSSAFYTPEIGSGAISSN